jgi:LemA protein
METNNYSAPVRKGGAKTGLLIAGAVILLLAFTVYGMFKGAYNQLVAQDQQVKTAWAQVDNVLQRRSDLIPTLVATVKGITGHEEKVFGDIADARARLAGAGAGPSAAKIEASNEVSGAISRLLMIQENYPQLKSNESFLGLQASIEGSENRLTHAREQYNTTVQGYNNVAKSFPMVLFVGMTGFDREKPFFQAPESARQVHMVDFGNGKP